MKDCHGTVLDPTPRPTLRIASASQQVAQPGTQGRAAASGFFFPGTHPSQNGCFLCGSPPTPLKPLVFASPATFLVCLSGHARTSAGAPLGLGRLTPFGLFWIAGWDWGLDWIGLDLGGGRLGGSVTFWLCCSSQLLVQLSTAEYVLRTPGCSRHVHPSSLAARRQGRLNTTDQRPAPFPTHDEMRGGLAGRQAGYPTGQLPGCDEMG